MPDRALLLGLLNQPRPGQAFAAGFERSQERGRIAKAEKAQTEALQAQGARDDAKFQQEFAKNGLAIRKMIREDRQSSTDAENANTERVFGLVGRVSTPEEFAVLQQQEPDLRGINYETGKMLAKVYGEEIAPPKPVSNIGKQNLDVRNGFATQEEVTEARKPRPGVQVNVGQDGNIELTKSTQNAVQADLLEIDSSLQNLENIGAGFDPKFLEIGNRLGLASTATQEKLGIRVNESDRQELERFTTFRRDAIEQLNTAIQNITGAAITESEAPRIIAQIPNPGQGIFDGDSPTEFKAKYDGVVRSLKQARARAVYTATQGIPFDRIPLGSIEGIMRARAEDLAAEGLEREAIKAQLKQEFGL